MSQSANMDSQESQHLNASPAPVRLPKRSGSGVIQWLQYVSRRDKPESTPYVHPKMVSFLNEAQLQEYLTSKSDRQYYRSTATKYDMLSEFLSALQPRGKHAWFAACAFPPTANIEYSRNEPVAYTIWHMMSVGVISLRDRPGKAMILYNNDIDDFGQDGGGGPGRLIDVLNYTPLLSLFFALFNEPGGCELWVNKQNPEHFESKRCQELALTELERWILVGDEPFSGEADVRVDRDYWKVQV